MAHVRSLSILLLSLTNLGSSTAESHAPTSSSSILVAGSLNADTFLPIARFPSSGENLTLLPNCHPEVDLPGGKGCNQAVACSKLSRHSDSIDAKDISTSFLGQFGNDPIATTLQSTLLANNIDISLCGQSKTFPSGRGYVMLVPQTGEVSAVVSGGSNLFGWGRWGVKNNNNNGREGEEMVVLTDQQIQEMISPHSLLLLQCEIPSHINLRLSHAASKLKIPIILDVGGEDRRMERELLERCDWLVPNESELERLAASYESNDDESDVNEEIGYGKDMQQHLEQIQSQIGSSLNLQSILKSVHTLQKIGANNVLVTLGSRGSLLIRKHDTETPQSPPLYQPPYHLPPGASVVDETGAGDCYRAGFAVALLEHCGNSFAVRDGVNEENLLQCMKFASAAGALAVTKKGAVPSIPSRREVEELMLLMEKVERAEAIPRGGGSDTSEDNFPFVFGSRINSMKDRLDLLDPSTQMKTPHDFLRRQATIRGLGCVDFNYPQHFDNFWTAEEAKHALDEVNLVAGAVCLRYPSKFARGAMNHPDPALRRSAIEMTKDAAKVARILGCNEVVVWSAYDGYDYPFQVNYQEKWEQIVEAFRECCDSYPDIRWSLEFKPTDENTRFFTVPSTGAAMLLVKEIDRPNMGLTLDVGHMLMAGENPGQSISMVGDKLFGIQLNDGYTRLASEDGMMFGSVHPSLALEAMYQLRQINFQGHFYFDTFPQRTDPVREAEYNIRRVKEFWRA
eukprot:scaffold15096_cov200-Alexandrium_tamarense.AAC.4